MLASTMALVALVLFANVPHAAVALTNISFQGSWDQCQPPPILTSEPDVTNRLKPPVHLFLVPINASITRPNVLQFEVRHMSIKTWHLAPSTGTLSTAPVLPLSARTQVLAVIRDNTGSGGASLPFIVGSSPNSTCLSSETITTPPSPPIFTIKSPSTPCRPLTISWDPSSPQIPSNRVSVHAVVPGGATFRLGSRRVSSGSVEWSSSLSHGTQFLLAFNSISDDGSETLLETSALMTSGGDDASSRSAGCRAKSSPALSYINTPAHLFDATTSQSPIHVPGMKRGTGENIPLIVGVAIGGVALLILSGTLMYLWRERLQHGLSLGRSSPYRHNTPTRIPSSPEASWAAAAPSPSQTPQQGLFPASPIPSPGDLEKGLSGGENPSSRERERRSKRKGKERERPRKREQQHPQPRQASSSTSNSLLPPPPHAPRRPPGLRRGASATSATSSSGPDIPLPDLNLDALNSVEASDLFTAPTLVGSSSSASQLSPGGGSIATITSTPPASKRRKESKRPRYEEIPIPELNMDVLNTVEASDLFTAPALSVSPPPAAEPSSSRPPTITVSSRQWDQDPIGDKKKKSKNGPPG